jgi:hypothetical protein
LRGTAEKEEHLALRDVVEAAAEQHTASHDAFEALKTRVAAGKRQLGLGKHKALKEQVVGLQQAVSRLQRVVSSLVKAPQQRHTPAMPVATVQVDPALATQVGLLQHEVDMIDAALDQQLAAQTAAPLDPAIESELHTIVVALYKLEDGVMSLSAQHRSMPYASSGKSKSITDLTHLVEHMTRLSRRFRASISAISKHVTGSASQLHDEVSSLSKGVRYMHTLSHLKPSGYQDQSEVVNALNKASSAWEKLLIPPTAGQVSAKPTAPLTKLGCEWSNGTCGLTRQCKQLMAMNQVWAGRVSALLGNQTKTLSRDMSCNDAWEGKPWKTATHAKCARQCRHKAQLKAYRLPSTLPIRASSSSKA